jgi:M6 family metalloprotease-like protein
MKQTNVIMVCQGWAIPSPNQCGRGFRHAHRRRPAPLCHRHSTQWLTCISLSARLEQNIGCANGTTLQFLGRRHKVLGARDMRWIKGVQFSLAAGFLFVLPSVCQMAYARNQHNSCTDIRRELVVRVEFRDVWRPLKREFVEQRFVKAPARYFREMSYGKTCLVGTVAAKKYALPGSIRRYYVPWQNLKVDKIKLQHLMSITLSKVERDIDVSKFDIVVFVLSANAKQWGNQGLNAYPGLLGLKPNTVFATKAERKLKGGVAIYAVSATRSMSKIIHNIAHIIGGVRAGQRVLPDMYDQDIASNSRAHIGSNNIKEALLLAQRNMGAWDPMSCGYCQQLGGVPGFSSWTKRKLGWIARSKIRTVRPGETADVTLGPLERGSSSTLAIRIPLTSSTYYLVENRESIGYDRNLPGHGVLIMYADDRILNSRHGRAPVRLINADPSVPNLNGAAFDVGRRNAFSDQAHSISIQILRKKGNIYQIRIARP